MQKLRKIISHDTVMVAQPSLIELFGRAGAQFINQLHYWLENPNCGETHEGKKWIYNTESEWAEQLKLSSRQIRRYVSILTQQGIISVRKLNAHKSNRTNYFCINYETLTDIASPINSKISTETRSFVHEDKMSSSSGQNVPIYIDTETTNIDFNKSEEQVEQDQKIKSPKEEKKKTTTAQDMLQVWNDNFGCKSPAHMSPNLAAFLVKAFTKKFGRDMAQWRRYCALIKTSEYLMGEKFSLSISWALNFETIDRLRRGELGVKAYKLEATEVFTIDEKRVEQMINDMDESEEVKSYRRLIAQVVGFANYHSWFHQANFAEKNGEILMVAPNDFVENQWSERFSSVFKLHHTEISRKKWKNWFPWLER